MNIPPPPPHPSAPAGPSAHLAASDLPAAAVKLARIMRANIWAGVAVAAIGLATTWLFVRDHVFSHTAEVNLVADSRVGRIINSSDDRQLHPDLYENVLRNLVAGMESREFHRYLARHLPAAEAEAFPRSFPLPADTSAEDNLTDIISGMVRIKRDRGRELITVVVKHPEASTARRLADRFATGYLGYIQEDIQRSNRDAAAALQESATQLTREIRSLEDDLRKYREENRLVVAEKFETIATEQMKRLSESMLASRLELDRLELNLTRANADLAAAPLPFSNPTLAAFGDTRELRAELEKAEAARLGLAEHYGPNHPAMLEVTGLIARHRASLARNFQTARRELETQRELAAGIVRQLDAQYAALSAESIRVARLRVESEIRTKEIAAKQGSLEAALNRIAQAKIRSEMPVDVLRLVDSAVLKRTLVPPRQAVWAAGALGSVVAFFAVPVLLFVFNTRVSGDGGVKAQLGRELLAAVPRIRGVKAGARARIMPEDADPLCLQAFMTIAGQLCLRAVPGQALKVLVTSTAPAEGKSLLARNLAAAFARLHRRTVLVDLDLRKPSQHGDSALGDGAASGVLGALLEVHDRPSAGLHPVIPTQELEQNLFLLPAGAAESEPTPWLTSPRMGHMLAELARDFEIIIIDTPPAGVFQDALILARHVDTTVFVARHGFAGVRQARSVLSDLDAAGASVLGVVLNGALPRHARPELTYRQLTRKNARYYGAYTRARSSPQAATPRGEYAPAGN